MADNVDAGTRSRIMARVRSKDTLPELAFRKTLFSRGLRYRVHGADLPGKPDLVFPRFRAVVFINGCLWHWHGCPRSRLPATNAEYWTRKINRNQERDRRNRAALLQGEWRVLVVWECALKRTVLTKAADLAIDWLHGNSASGMIEPMHSGNQSRVAQLHLLAD